MASQAMYAARTGRALLQEKIITFSAASKGQRIMAALLGMANVAGVFWIGRRSACSKFKLRRCCSVICQCDVHALAIYETVD